MNIKSNLCSAVKPAASDSSVPSLEEVHSIYRTLTKKLIENHTSITTMESCTSGFLASLITDTEGSSAVIKGAFVTYSNEAKTACGVDSSIISEYGVYSLQTAAAMAKAAMLHYKSDIAIGVTGTFGNVDPNNEDSVPGKVYVAVINKSKASGNTNVEKILTLPINITRFESKLFVAKEVAALI